LGQQRLEQLDVLGAELLGHSPSSALTAARIIAIAACPRGAGARA
jgi:hypothetical protein